MKNKNLKHSISKMIEQKKLQNEKFQQQKEQAHLM